jgi:Undecaprenyl-phosphate galactose phosphotransferase WbaP
MATSTAISTAFRVSVRPQRWFNMVSCLVAADVVSLLASVETALLCKFVFHGLPGLAAYVRLWPFLFVFVAVYALVGLYSGVSLSPPEELRRATLSSALIFLVLTATTVSIRGATHRFTWTMLLAMLSSVVLVPLMRGVVRRRFGAEPWWGSEAVIFGAGEVRQRILKNLMEEPGLGLKPVAIVDDSPDAPGAVLGVPVMAGFDLAAAVPESHKFGYAVVAMPDPSSARIAADIDRYGLHFSRVLMIPNFANFCSLWVDTKSVGGMLGLEVCHQTLLPERQWPKRILDLVLTIAAAPLLLPVIGLIVLWIKLDSRGPALYSQARIGRGGVEFRVWKFRSMVQNAEGILQDFLEKHPILCEEWERDHKLKHDPRVTRSGRFLRRTSLDELPQLWNVVKGEMSLVGPRPIVQAEITKYGQAFDLYTKAKGGLTGLWQVSGRNDTSYEERVILDTFYVRNWSVWLDLYIFFRTTETLLFRRGAY